MKHIMHCPKCNTFTMKPKCSCGTNTLSTKPAKYSPQKYAEYRRKAKEEMLIKQGLI